MNEREQALLRFPNAVFLPGDQPPIGTHVLVADTNYTGEIVGPTTNSPPTTRAMK